MSRQLGAREPVNPPLPSGIHNPRPGETINARPSNPTGYLRIRHLRGLCLRQACEIMRFRAPGRIGGSRHFGPFRSIAETFERGCRVGGRRVDETRRVLYSKRPSLERMHSLEFDHKIEPQDRRQDRPRPARGICDGTTQDRSHVIGRVERVPRLPIPAPIRNPTCGDDGTRDD